MHCAKREAAEAAAQAELGERNELSDHAVELLSDIAEQLFAAISEQAPAAEIKKRKDGHTTVYEARLGKGLLRMTVGQYRQIPKTEFLHSEWDVICGDAILVQSSTYQRSASLWYADVGRQSEYLWIEMGYWTLGGQAHHVPTHLAPGPDAALAASKVLHTWRKANAIRIIEGDGLDAFCQRWMDLFAQAVEGVLAHPSHLPES